MRFAVLGPVEVDTGEARVELRGARQRALLAALLLRANETVPTHDLGAAVWDRPPSSAGANLRTHLAGLRRALGPAAARLATRPEGYALAVEPDELDLLGFRADRGDGERLLRAGDVPAAVARLDAALARWRGEPFAGVPRTVVLAAEAAHLDEERLSTVESRAEARLLLGDHEGLDGELRRETAAHPFRERLWAHLMLALHRVGRRSEALSAYAEVRLLLADELGVEPGPDLRRLRDRILRADPGLAAPTGAPPIRAASPARAAVAGGSVAPAQLPPAVPGFTGRDAEVDRLRAGLGDPAAPGVWTVTGPAGAGASALALHVAHLVRPAHPDGQLYLDLRGGREREPVTPAAGLDRLLRSLGVPGGAVPRSLEDRVALYRSRLADRRMLVLLDNAVDEAQVRPFLPGTATSSVLVTSRRTLSALEGAQVVALDVLPPADSLTLLRRAVGSRVDAEPDAARRIAGYCGGLPLALRVVAAKLIARPHWRLSRLADLLADERSRLAELSRGDLDVRASLAISLEELTREQRRAFRLLCVVDLADFPAWVVAPLLGVDRAEAENTVEALADARLVEVVGPDRAGQDRYRVPELIRVFGRGQPAEEDPGPALRRLCRAWTTLAVRTAAGLPDPGWRLDLSCGEGADPPPVTPADPVEWFEAEWSTLGTLVHLAAGWGLTGQCWRLAAATAAFADRCARFEDWDRLNTLALGLLDVAAEADAAAEAALVGEAADAAEAVDLARGRAVLGLQRGLLRARQHRFGEAFRCFRTAAVRFEALGDPAGAAYGWHGVGWMYEWHGGQGRARSCHERALAGFRAAGDAHGCVAVFCSLGAIARRSGDVATAAGHLDRALTLVGSLASAPDELAVRLETGRLHQTRGDLAAAAEEFRRSLELALDLGDPDMAAHVRLFLAETLLGVGRSRAARDQLDRAGTYLHEAADRAGQAWLARLLSEAYRRDGEAERALAHAERAWALAAGLELPQERARAERELAYALWLAGRPAEARRAAASAAAALERAGFQGEAAAVREVLDGAVTG